MTINDLKKGTMIKSMGHYYPVIKKIRTINKNGIRFYGSHEPFFVAIVVNQYLADGTWTVRQ